MPTTSSIPQFGIAWKLTVSSLPDNNGDTQQFVVGSDSWTPEPLHVEFEVYQTIAQAFWFADIVVYNLNTPTTQLLLKQGMTVKLEAGFMNKIGYGTIFEGTLFQPTWERVDGINEKLTLHCIVGLIENTNNFVAFNTAAGLNQREIILRMASAPNIVYPLDGSNVQLPNSKPTSRGEVFFGQPIDYLQKIATQNTSNLWITNMAINIRALVDGSADVPVLHISPETGLIGTPQQTQDGVDFKNLMDARITLRTQVQLEPNTAIRQLNRVQGNFPTVLDSKGNYAVAAVRHRGNTRGNEWHTYVTGITFIGSRLGLVPPY